MRFFRKGPLIVSSATHASAASGKAKAGWIDAVPILAWAFLAALWFLFTELYPDASRLLDGLGDTDDATRLYQVREFLAGRGWYDLTLTRIGAPDPLVSHWSRLVDVPIAGLLWLFGAVFSQASAELAVRTVWPLLLLVALAWILARDARSRAGNHLLAATLFAIAFTVFAHAGVQRFMPGRLDHHNLMILCAVAGLLFLAESFSNKRMAVPAGLFLGFGVAVGYEALVLTYAGLVAAGLYALWTGDGLKTVARTAQVMTATLAGCLVLTVPPSALLSSPCDVLGLNLVVLTAAGAMALTLAGWLQHRLAFFELLSVMTVVAMAGVALALALEPSCARGPFAALSDDVQRLWLSRVQETQTLFQSMAKKPAGGLVFLVMMAIALVSAESVRRQDGDARSTFQLIMLVIAGLFSLWQIKFTPYANFLMAPPIAIALTRLKPFGELSKLGTMLMAYLLINPLTVALVIVSATNAMGLNETAKQTSETPADEKDAFKACMATAAIQPLGELAPGLIATHFDFGPAIVALTPHRVVAAPYHRLGPSILAFEKIDNGTPDEALSHLKSLGVDYVVQCQDWERNDRSEASLYAALKADQAPDYLTPVPLKAETPYRVWRVTP